MTEKIEQVNISELSEAEKAELAKFRAEVAEMVNQEDLQRRGYAKNEGASSHMYKIEADGSIRFIMPEQLTLADARMWERVARFLHFYRVLGPKNIPIPEAERVTAKELSDYENNVHTSPNFSREFFLAKINNVLAGIWGKEELAQWQKDSGMSEEGD